jgi:phosphohistidine phosphatase
VTQLCLVRHAIAEERGQAWPDDRLRPLTREGKERMAGAAMGLSRLLAPEIILTSPLVRARQTAEIVQAVFPGVHVQVCDALAAGSHQDLATATAGFDGDVIAVGHEPSISGALSWFLTASDLAASFDVKKGSAHLLGFDGAPAAGHGWLLWSLPPRVLRDLGQLSAHADR